MTKLEWFGKEVTEAEERLLRRLAPHIFMVDDIFGAEFIESLGDEE